MHRTAAPRQTITPYLFYEDVGAALRFLVNAFGFQETLRCRDEDGHVTQAEMRLGDAAISSAARARITGIPGTSTPSASPST
jgi:uncharacterized glyoxalase superfamily protein PhnB